MYFPNQKQIKINRELVEKSNGRLFLVAFQDNISEAMITLSHTGFKVYMSLIFNKNNYCLEYSPKYVSQITGMCLDTARKGLKELQTKGYLIPTDDREKFYNFYEVRRYTKINIQKEKREFIDNDTGEVLNLTYAELLENIGNEVEAKQIWRDAE